MALIAEIHREGTAGPLARLLLIVIPLVGVLMPLLVLLAVTAATVALWRWRAEREHILDMPEAKELNWPRLEQPGVLVFGQILPLAVALGFLLAWIPILIQTRMA